MSAIENVMPRRRFTLHISYFHRCANHRRLSSLAAINSMFSNNHFVTRTNNMSIKSKERIFKLFHILFIICLFVCSSSLTSNTQKKEKKKRKCTLEAIQHRSLLILLDAFMQRNRCLIVLRTEGKRKLAMS